MRLAISFIIIFCCISVSIGMINPNFTPVDLVRQATNIAQVDIHQADDKGSCTATLGKNLQGTTPAKLTMQLDTTSEELVRVFPAAFGTDAKRTALLFTGDFSRAVLQGADEVADKPAGALYLKTTWFALYQQENGDYRITMDPLNLKAVWAGGDATLAQAIEYIIDDPRADIPVAVGTTWDTDIDVAAIANVNRLLVVNSIVAGSPLLLVLSDDGDRAFQAKTEGKGFTDVTTALKLTTKSKLATAGYFNDDNLLDMALYDGKTLRIALNTGKGDFNIVDTGINGTDWKNITAIGNGAGAHDSLVVGKNGAIQVFSAQNGRYAQSAELSATAEQLATLGSAGRCVVADFTGDNIPDVLQTYANGALLFAGKTPAEFAAPQLALKASLGEKITSVKLGDFDADGLVDVLVTSEIGCTFLINQGGGKFRESFNETGEIT
ncbi:MAG: VCBS repeat-containing protein, partial [bacterium]